ncbi:glycosyltransferase family 2 protein [Acinetobacter qingfengensis]|uniref:Glycosyl transferase n=1 Tax=Acinetobacter qingfengensis TaxID=1262585 RepID=A0A1E7R2W7_9GAMM|nr:glycosyltransferase family 2 protein [Acinetobacter qingfengensis]KAA8733854.1 glycosyltransferase family 2 protein [Acinetobacter qingfengensis]OEY93633.1 glycosyl transferase [Acinetobacter qingfengensis]
MNACFILPVYNHPHYLHRLLAQLQSYALPVILIDDGSEQSCKQVIAELEQTYSITVLTHRQNMGKGQAVMTGLIYANQQGLSHALQLDVDGQHDWSDIDKFLSAAAQSPQAMIVGQPIFDQSVPKKRLYGRYATHVWVWINSLSLQIKDSMCGFRVYPVAMTCQMFERYHLTPRMGFDSEILVYLSWHGVTFINIATQVVYPKDGISHFDVWQDNLALSKMHGKLFLGMLKRAPRLIQRNFLD